MRRLLRSRRGTVAFAAVIAAIPLIGVVGLGAEAGSWYVTKQHAQNAADAAAYSGALRLACTLGAASGAPCADTQPVEYRGKEFAAQNAFCNAADTAYPGTRCVTPSAGTSQMVAIATATSAAGPWTNPAGASFVRASVNQTQPTYLVAVLGMSAVTIGAQAIAQVQNPQKVCALGLQSITLIGGADITGSNCAFQSDASAKIGNNVKFEGAGMGVDAVSGCVSPCGTPSGATYNWYTAPATNPLISLDSTSMFGSVSTSGTNSPAPMTCDKSNNCTLPASTTQAYGSLSVNGGQTLTLAAGGTYIFYDAPITINANATLTGNGVNIVLLCPKSGCKSNSKITVNGGTVQLSANSANATFPALNGILIYDQSGGAVNISGGANSYFEGTMYFPKADVTWSGNTQSTTGHASQACTEVIGNTLTVSGNAYLSATGCAALSPQTQVVYLVQ